MEANPKSFPIVSYVLSRLNSIAHEPPSEATEPDIEQPTVVVVPRHPSGGGAEEVELVGRMPRLGEPGLLVSMASAISNVAQTRSVLRALGHRPNHEAVDVARTRAAEIDADLSLHLEEIVTAPCPEGVDVRAWRAELAERERECRAAAEREREAYIAVVQLDEMHEAYELMLRDAEDRLVRIYKEGHAPDAEAPPPVAEEVQMNKEVIGILQQASVTCLERVDLSSRKLSMLPEAFGKFRGLISLNVSNNQLEAIPNAIGGLEHLDELCLSSNFLVSLPDSSGLLLNLKTLDVSGNKLKALPDSISMCRSLVELDASYNELTYLPTNIGYELVNLEKLLVHLNKLRSLPTSICEMKSVHPLDAHFNELQGLPYAIGKLMNLESINLSSNFSDLRDLPSTIGDLCNLKELDLSNNQIHALPDTFGRLEKLIKLNLEQNPLVMPPKAIVSQGVEAIKEYMRKRLLDILLEEERKITVEEKQQTQAGWLTRGTLWLNNWVTGVSGSVAEFLGPGDKSYKDPILDQQL